MDFYALATMEFLSCLGSEDDASKAYLNMYDHVYGDVDLDEEIIFWEPFENWPVENIIEAIDNLASRFEGIYQQGASDGARDMLKTINNSV